MPALPLRRRAVVRTINPRPILCSLAQTFANRIHQDVTGFLVEFVMIAQAVVKKITLRMHAMFSHDELLPVLDSCCHSRFAWERHDCMKMIRHKQAKAAVPGESRVIEFDSSEYGIAGVCATQLVFARRHTVNSDEEPTALGHPLWNCVRQLLADEQVHPPSVPRRSQARKRKG